MEHVFRRGDVVLLNAFPAQVIQRVVWDDLGDVLTICREDEYNAALKADRKAITVGFKKSYVVGIDSSVEIRRKD